MDVDSMRAEIARLTGATTLPDSTNPKHLAARLAALRKRVTITVSVTTAALGALARLAETHAPAKTGGRPRRGTSNAKQPNLSALCRQALAEYVRNHGDVADAALLEERP